MNLIAKTNNTIPKNLFKICGFIEIANFDPTYPPIRKANAITIAYSHFTNPVSYTHLTLPTSDLV